MCLDLEPCAVWAPNWHKARKPHRCNECKRTIKPGERYLRTFYVDQDSGAGSFATCWICDAFLDIVQELCGGEPQRSNGGLLGESLTEHEYVWRDAANRDGREFAGPLDESESDENLYGPGLWDLWSACTWPNGSEASR